MNITYNPAATLIEIDEAKGGGLKWAATFVRSMDGVPQDTTTFGRLWDTADEAKAAARRRLDDLATEDSRKRARLHAAAPAMRDLLHEAHVALDWQGAAYLAERIRGVLDGMEE